MNIKETTMRTLPLPKWNTCSYVSRTPFSWNLLERRITWWNKKRFDNINPNYTEILYGYKPETN